MNTKIIKDTIAAIKDTGPLILELQSCKSEVGRWANNPRRTSTLLFIDSLIDGTYDQLSSLTETEWSLRKDEIISSVTSQLNTDENIIYLKQLIEELPDLSRILNQQDELNDVKYKITSIKRLLVFMIILMLTHFVVVGL